MPRDHLSHSWPVSIVPLGPTDRLLRLPFLSRQAPARKPVDGFADAVILSPDERDNDVIDVGVEIHSQLHFSHGPVPVPSRQPPSATDV